MVGNWIETAWPWLVLLLVAGFILQRALREPYNLEITQTVLTAPGSVMAPSQQNPKQPAGFDESAASLEAPSPERAGLRVVLLTDLHAEWLRISPKRLRAALMDLDFDCLLFGGDLTGRHHRPSKAAPWLAVLKDVLATRQVPGYAVVGNHDSAASLDLLRQAGFQILRNSSARITDRQQVSWQLLGLDILKKGQPDFATALAGQPGQWVPAAQRIVLAHNPDTIFQVPAGAAGFFLAGHFHGGQIYMPFHLEFFLLRREKVGRMGYHKGAFALMGLACYISRGLGSVLFPLRLGSRPEIALLHIMPAA